MIFHLLPGPNNWYCLLGDDGRLLTPAIFQVSGDDTPIIVYVVE